MAWIRQAASKIAQSVSNPTVRYSGLAVLTAPEWRLRRNGISTRGLDEIGDVFGSVLKDIKEALFDE